MQKHLDAPRPAESPPPSPASRDDSSRSSASNAAQTGLPTQVEPNLAPGASIKPKVPAERVKQVRLAVAALNARANLPLPLPLPPPTSSPSPPALTVDGTPQIRTVGFSLAGEPSPQALEPSLSDLFLEVVLSSSPSSPRASIDELDGAHSPTTSSFSTSPAPLQLSTTTSSPLLVLSTSPPSHWTQYGVDDLDPDEVQNWRNDSSSNSKRKNRQDSWRSFSTARSSLRLSRLRALADALRQATPSLRPQDRHELEPLLPLSNSPPLLSLPRPSAPPASHQPPSAVPLRLFQNLSKCRGTSS